MASVTSSIGLVEVSVSITSVIIVHNFLPLDALLGFATKSEHVKQKIEHLIQKYNYDKPVAVRNWYY